MRILVLNPFGGETREREHCLAVARPDAVVEFDSIKDSYPLNYVQYRYFRHLCAGHAIDRIVAAEREGFDAVVIACMYDPGLIEARELVDIPLVGAFESSCHVAAMLGAAYAVITVEQNVVPVTWEMARLYGVSEKLVSVKHIGIPAGRIYEDVMPPEEILERTFSVVGECVADGAEVIVLGCTLISHLLTERYADPHAVLGVPVVDPLLVAYKTAEMMVDLRLKANLPAVSRLGGYARPPAGDVETVWSYYGKEFDAVSAGA
jgi:allantoin racemase